MRSVNDRQRAQEAIDNLELPDWVEGVNVSDILDLDDEPALEALVVMQAGVLPSGEAISLLALRMRDAVRGAGVELYTYSNFTGADESDVA